MMQGNASSTNAAGNAGISNGFNFLGVGSQLSQTTTTVGAKQNLTDGQKNMNNTIKGFGKMPNFFAG
jgi:hypothetical protein